MHQELHEAGQPGEMGEQEHKDGHDHAHGHHGHGPPGGWRPTPAFWRSARLLAVLAVAALLVYSSCFFVDETEYVYVTTFGKPARLCVEPGLRLKWPYQSLIRLDRRLQVSNPPGSQMLTRDKGSGGSAAHRLSRPEPGQGRPQEDAQAISRSLGGPPLTVEWFMCWRLPSVEFVRSLAGTGAGREPAASGVSAPVQAELEKLILRFLRSLGSVTAAQDRLRERIDAMLKAEVGRMSLSEFVSLKPDQIRLDDLNQRLTDQIRQVALERFGLEVVDVRIKRFNHPAGVKPAIFDMIRTERQGVARRYRAEGEGEAARIRSEADKERAQILSKANAEAERIRGQGDAEAMKIANAAHAKDPAFYRLLKTLDTYRTILNEKTTVVLSADSPLLRLLTTGPPGLSDQPAPAGAQPVAGDGRATGSPPKRPGGSTASRQPTTGDGADAAVQEKRP